MSWEIEMNAHILGRRATLVEEVLACVHAPMERTSSVSKPLTCYRCQQGYTPSLDVGSQHQLSNHHYKQFNSLTYKKKQAPWVDICQFKFMANLPE